MNNEQAYDIWSEQYDTNLNKTRDVEASALRTVLSQINFKTCLEIGCGTGKNTEWLVTKAEKIVAADLSSEMLAKAKQKIKSNKVAFIKTDILEPWVFTDKKFDLIVFSLVLEHIENLDHVFCEASKQIAIGGYIYIGELHPFRQYSGTKARFETGQGLTVLECFNHHISDFIHSAKKYGFHIVEIEEFFDDNDRSNLPRILTLLFHKEN